MSTRSSLDQSSVDAGSKFLTFELDGGAYGIPILIVREIIAVQPVTPLPRMQLEGVFNLRGRIIPVLDLRKSLGLSAAEHDRATCVIVLDVESADQTLVNIGCIVNAVREVSHIRGEDIQESPSVGGRLEADCILGLAKSEASEQVVTLLNMGVVLADFLSHTGGFDTMSMTG